MGVTTLSTAFETMMAEAKTFVDSGFLPRGVNTPAKAVAIMTMSKELGIGYWTGFNGINVISGKPTISPQLMLALIYKRHPNAVIDIKGDAKACTVFMQRKDGQSHSETFTIEDAAKIRTKEDDKQISLTEKYNWRQQPAVMLKWRAVAACARVIFPDVIMGFYTPEEIEPDSQIDYETGEVVVDVPALPDGEGGNGHHEPEPVKTEPKQETKAEPPADVKLPASGKLMSTLDGKELYAIQTLGPALCGLEGEGKHFENRWRSWFNVSSLRDVKGTVGDFLTIMKLPEKPDGMGEKKPEAA